MKRVESLSKLSREHAASLKFADQMEQIATEGSDAELAEGVDRLKKYNEVELEKHLQHEERTIFMPMIKQHQEHAELCIQLGREHGLMRTLVEDITPQTARRDLAEFARVLRRHSIMEEEELFPLIETLFSREQQNEILNFVPWEPLH